MRRAALLFALPLVAGGCFFDSGDLSGTSFRCDQGEQCPPGFQCVSGQCTEGGGGGDGGGPADAALADAPSSSGCMPADGGGFPTIMLFDDFEDGVTADAWTSFADGESTVGESGGELVCAPVSHPAKVRFAGYRSAGTYNLEGHRAFVEVTAMVDTGTEAEARFLASVDESNQVFMIQKQGTLRFGFSVGGVDTELGSVTYNPTDHRYWQIREEGGTLYGEVSSDGASWSELGSGSAPGFLGAIEIELSAGTQTSVSNPGEAHYDNFNGGCL